MCASRFDPDNVKSRTLIKMIKKVEQLKQQGNDEFKAGRNEEAHGFYSEALALDGICPELKATLLCNRAAALQVKQT